jgi:hypothetical protein
MFPKHIWIGGHKYTLKFQRLDENNRGECKTDSNEIIIDNHRAGKTCIIETIFHEIAHATSEHFDLQPEDPTNKFYEHVISCCGKAMTLLIVQNIQFFKCVLSEIEKLVKEDKKCSKNKKKKRQ